MIRDRAVFWNAELRVRNGECGCGFKVGLSKRCKKKTATALCGAVAVGLVNSMINFE